MHFVISDLLNLCQIHLKQAGNMFAPFILHFINRVYTMIVPFVTLIHLSTFSILFLSLAYVIKHVLNVFFLCLNKKLLSLSNKYQSINQSINQSIGQSIYQFLLICPSNSASPFSPMVRQ